jgi:hypothetical protein
MSRGRQDMKGISTPLQSLASEERSIRFGAIPKSIERELPTLDSGKHMLTKKRFTGMS